jgi:hypothetical protein
MEYRNRKTGFVFSTESEVTGADWVAVDSKSAAAQTPLSAAPETGKAKPKKAVKPRKAANNGK